MPGDALSRFVFIEPRAGPRHDTTSLRADEVKADKGFKKIELA